MTSAEDESLRSLLESVLGHQYEIVRPLGRGGMGWVYLARERVLERFVAIKVLRPELALADGHRERFRREARIAARLNHPGILGLHSFGEIENLWYFVMTYVRGETLAEKIRREGFLPWTDALRILTEMTAALECAHRNGVVHRDIKPANILLDSESGHALLADFGISKMFGAKDTLTATGVIMGTPAFMSPEQVTGASDIDERADIYSLGTVAYVMLTGREPFVADSAAATAYRRLVEDAIPVESIVSSIPADLAAVIRKCMARDREARWPNARSLAEALESMPAVDRVPNVVRDVRSFGPYALLWVGGLAGFAVLSERSPSDRMLLMLVALIVPIGLVLHLWNGPGRGMRFVDLARIAAWPPEWWSVWWPRALRRPSDLWSRLPLVAKAARVMITVGFPLLIVLMLLRGRGSLDMQALYQTWAAPLEWGIVIAGALVVALAFIWTRRKGLAFDQSLRMVLGPTMSSAGWAAPEMTRLLAPASGKVREPVGDSPTDYLRAIRDLIPQFESDASGACERAAVTAENVLKMIDRMDGELKELARDAGPDEANRLAVQLEELESRGAGDTQERVELRELVRHQLEVVRRLQGRREIVVRQRAHLVDLLRTLWIAASNVAESSDGGSARLASLCAEIQSELDSSGQKG